MFQIFNGNIIRFSAVLHFSTQKMNFFIKDFFRKCDQIRNFLRIWSHLLKKSLMENFTFCAVSIVMMISQFYYYLRKILINSQAKKNGTGI